MEEPNKTVDVSQIDVVFLGAGFTRAATNGKSPLMADFFSQLDRRQHWQLWRFLEEVFQDPREANVEQALLYLEQLAASPLTGVDPFFDQCRERYRAVRNELDTYTIDRLGSLHVENDNWAANVLGLASAKTTVITTNYDNVAERVLSSRNGLRHHCRNTNCHHCKLCRIMYDDCASEPVDRHSEESWQGSLLKLHGSIAWRKCGYDSCDSCKCLIPDQHCRPFSSDPCPTCGGKCSPVLVPPSMVKSFDAFPGLKRIWNAAYLALSHAQSVLFFGFSFPTSDALINEMFRAAFALNRRTLEITIVDRDPDRPASILAELLGSDNESVIRLFDVPEEGVPAWLTSATPAASGLR